jgi:hypothetical protein
MGKPETDFRRYDKEAESLSYSDSHTSVDKVSPSMGTVSQESMAEGCVIQNYFGRDTSS